MNGAALMMACCAVIVSARGQSRAPGERIWTTSIELAAAPAVAPNGQVIAISSSDIVALSSDGTERWRAAETPTSPAEPPLVDEQGDVYVLTRTALVSYSSAGTFRWRQSSPRSNDGASLTLGPGGEILLKNGLNRYAYDRNGRELWKEESLIGGVIPIGNVPSPSASPVIVAADGTLRSIDDSGFLEMRAPDGRVISRETPTDELGYPPRRGRLLGLGPNGEAVSATVPSGQFIVRWTRPDGSGTAWSTTVPGFERSGYERILYGLCSPTGEVFIATPNGTVVTPHLGTGSRRWPEIARAITESGDIVCSDGKNLTVRRRDHTVAWTAPAAGSFFTLAPDGRVYGGGPLSAYHIGSAPAAGPWSQPRGDAAQRGRASRSGATSTPDVTTRVTAPATATFHESYPGTLSPDVYIQGPATLVWEKDGQDFSAAAADASLQVTSASLQHAGSFRLRIENSLGTTHSTETRVTVLPPSPIRPGLYHGTLSGPNDVYLLEITADRFLRFRSTGSRGTMRQRLDPTGTYPAGLTFPAPGYGGVVVRATAEAVEIASGGQTRTVTAAPLALPSGVRPGFYYGTSKGVVTQSARVDLALLPSGIVMGEIAGGRFELDSLYAPTFTINPSVLSGPVNASFRDRVVGGFGVRSATFTFDPAGLLRITVESAEASEHFVAVLAGTASGGRLANLSARAMCGSSERALVVGFVVDGRGRFLLRGIGPTLTTFGVSPTLGTPLLELRRSSGELIASNRAWGDHPSATVQAIIEAARLAGAFPLLAGSADSALFVPLGSGGYTASVAGAPDGEALVEMYGLRDGSAAAPRLINLSTRGELRAADEKVMVGFALESDRPQLVLLRGVGPSLRPFLDSTTPICGNPRLRVYSANGTLMAGNNDRHRTWQPPGATPIDSEQSVWSAGIRAGAFPLTDSSLRDAAVLLNLDAGSYTVHLDSEDGSTGAVLFEAYAVPPEY